jgi:hypothetical protein
MVRTSPSDACDVGPIRPSCRGVEDESGVWLAYTFGWRKVAAFPEEFSAMSYVSEHSDRENWNVAFAPGASPSVWPVSSCRDRSGGP